VSRPVYIGEAAAPVTRKCDWCDRTAASAHEIYRPRKKLGTGQFLYACPRHKVTAENAIAAKRDPPKAAA
jgi:hypothetical protein